MNTVFDIKIACHLLDPDISDENLELDKLLKQYSVTTATASNTSDLGTISNAINNLHGELGALLDMEVPSSSLVPPSSQKLQSPLSSLSLSLSLSLLLQ